MAAAARHPRPAPGPAPRSAVPLSQRLHDATRALHRAAECTPVMQRLLRGELGPEDYAALLAQLLTLYRPLESALARHADRDGFAAFGFPALFRVPALEADLARLGAPPSVLPPATRRCVARLRSLDRRRPTLLVAHAYVRYLGDLHGGQVLRRVVTRALGTQGRDLRFHDFGPPARVAAAIVRFRSALDALPLGEETAQALVGEARWAFAQHLAWFGDGAP
jgi:heme oxygenase